jgi:hypothetical protein
MIGSFFLAEFNLVQLLFGVHAPTLFGLLNALEFNLAFEVGVVYGTASCSLLAEPVSI